MEMTQRYDRAAPDWDRKIHEIGYPAAYHAFLLSHSSPVGTVLDVGTGTGAFARAWIAAMGSTDLTLLDISQAMLRQAHSWFKEMGQSPQLVHRSLQNFRPDFRFATVLASHVLEHFANPAQGMGELARCVQPGGKLILVVSKPHWCNWLIWLRFRHRWFSPGEVERLAKAQGLRHVQTHTFGSGPPSRTSLGYVFFKPKGET